MNLDNSVINKVSMNSSPEIASEIIPGMIELMERAGGVGIAAPQIGVLHRVIVCKINGVNVPMINPEITKFSNDRKPSKEGCLSFPGKISKVNRSRKVSVDFTDIDGSRVSQNYSGKAAIVVQHEVDHLDGITI